MYVSQRSFHLLEKQLTHEKCNETCGVPGDTAGTRSQSAYPGTAVPAKSKFALIVIRTLRAILIIFFLLPPLDRLINRSISISASINPMLMFMLLVVVVVTSLMTGAGAVEGRVDARGRDPPPAAARGAHGVIVARARGREGGATPLARGAAGHGTRQVCVCAGCCSTRRYLIPLTRL